MADPCSVGAPLEETCDSDDRPRSLRYRSVREQRQRLLDQPHVQGLTQYVHELRAQEPKEEVPYFDPLDGGINARVLFLFEKPGPMTSGADRVGSGFISRNNDDRTAEATFCFMVEAGIPRELTVTWNVVPWWNGTREVLSGELQRGVREVKNLIRRLPRLQAVVFVGKKANQARRYLERSSGSQLAFFSSPHPSPIVRATRRDQWESIPNDWAKVKPVLGLK